MYDDDLDYYSDENFNHSIKPSMFLYYNIAIFPFVILKKLLRRYFEIM